MRVCDAFRAVAKILGLSAELVSSKHSLSHHLPSAVLAFERGVIAGASAHWLNAIPVNPICCIAFHDAGESTAQGDPATRGHFGSQPQTERTSTVNAVMCTPKLVFEEQIWFDTFGLMIDVSRGAVPTVATLKRAVLRAALSGYNRVLLYMEDMFQLPNDVFFGYMRGAYTGEELRLVDEFAVKLGIQLIPHIQTLGHMEQILQWPAFGNLKDTKSIILTDHDESYALLRKMLSMMKSSFSSGMVHIGMVGHIQTCFRQVPRETEIENTLPGCRMKHSVWEGGGTLTITDAILKVVLVPAKQLTSSRST
eukprot:scaffold1206_cov388-Prasinococcus_capsulatus_cf.AAC.13